MVSGGGWGVVLAFNALPDDVTRVLLTLLLVLHLHHRTDGQCTWLSPTRYSTGAGVEGCRRLPHTCISAVSRIINKKTNSAVFTTRPTCEKTCNRRKDKVSVRTHRVRHKYC